MIVNLSRLDTRPGSGWAAPTEPVSDYRVWMRRRYGDCPITRQRLQVAARLRAARASTVSIVGPYAADLSLILDDLIAGKAGKAGRPA